MLARARQRLAAASLPAQRYVRVGQHLSAVQTVVAAAKTTFAMALLSTAQPVVPVVGALMAFGVYNANNLADGDEDAVNQPAKARFVRRWRREILAAAVVAALAAVALATIYGGPTAGAVVLLPGLCGLLYSLPLAPGDRGRRLKDVFVANTTLVAAAWAIPIAFLPAVLGAGAPIEAAAAVCAYFFLRTFVSVEVFNVRDVDGDRQSGVATLPVVLGLTGTQRVLLVLDAASLVLVVWAIGAVGLPAGPALAVVPITAYSIVLTMTLGDVTDWDARCLAKDGEYLALGALGLLAFF